MAHSPQIGELKSKLTAAEHNEAILREQASALRTLATRFRSDLQLAVREIQNPKALAASIAALFAKYCKDGTDDEAVALDEEVQQEHNRQREFLERSIASLRHKVCCILQTRSLNCPHLRSPHARAICSLLC